ncbi:hypothetical protein D9Q98_002859 [Chlorella vulgaris]|uniref:Uncharacterized protein n=1 Tax=Chlorella vulgaris TaxID=3077 RepID=A0A9D4TU81_CHLVU|nr:hypothetical protein D9Q98_002859 [Chlorella vulgaris]
MAVQAPMCGSHTTAAARHQPGCSGGHTASGGGGGGAFGTRQWRHTGRLLVPASQQQQRQQLAEPRWRGATALGVRRPPGLTVVCQAAAAGQPGAAPAVHADYVAKAGDAAVLQRPLKAELQSEEIQNVFGYPRNLRDKYQLGAVLGAGSFGVVRECTERRPGGRRFAVKSINKIPKNSRPTPRYLLKIQTEVDAMQQLGGSLDAVFLQDVFEDDTAVHLVMELCEGGSVLDGLRDGEYSERQVAHIMRAVVRFIAQCHAKGLIYRDIKPDNFLLVSKATPRSPLARIGEALGLGSGEQEVDSPVKATDFGLSIRHRPEDPPLKSRSGTPAYMAPEVIQQSYDERADIWSAGIMMYQLLTGKFPFWDNVRDCTLQQVWKSILTDKINWNAAALREVSPPARDLLKQMLDRNPAKRLRAGAALRHPWLQDADSTSALPLRSSVVQRLQRFATYGHLKQLVLRIIADDMAEHPTTQKESQELIEGLTALFGELDVNASGSVSMDELVNGLDRLGYDIRVDEMEHLMQRVDVNQDGEIQLTEFVAGLVDWKALQNDSQWGRWVQMAFDRLDKNGDGWLDLEELAQQLPDDGSSDAERVLEARRMLREADTNGDGRISKDEFMELLMGTSLPDTLNQYDPRIKLGLHLDEALEELQSLNVDISPASSATSSSPPALKSIDTSGSEGERSAESAAAAAARVQTKQKGSKGSKGSSDGSGSGGSSGSGSGSKAAEAAEQ